MEELNDLPIRAVNGAVVYIHDVAHVRDGYRSADQHRAHDGQRGALLTRLKNGQASTLDIVQQVNEPCLPRIMSQLPPATEDDAAVRSVDLRARRRSTVSCAKPSSPRCLTGLMILLFLGSWRSTLIVAHLHSAVDPDLADRPERAGRNASTS